MRGLVILGITGQFGSGCTTLARVLGEAPFNFKAFYFSKLIKALARRRGLRKTTRSRLQDLGNEMRASHHQDYWASKVVRQIEKHAQNTHGNQHYVVEGFRNVAEIRLFKKRFRSDFYLIALNVEEQDVRWKRVNAYYNQRGLPELQFTIDDARDQDERLPHGQQVRECVYEADMIFDNPTIRPEVDTVITEKLQRKIEPYINLILGKEKQRPTEDERRMREAYKVSEDSDCLKRRVGAVIYDRHGKRLSSGYNAPPFDGGCSQQFHKCHKEIIAELIWKPLKDWAAGKKCPACLKKLKFSDGYRCGRCKQDLEPIFKPTKGAEHCLAIHAEDNAILKAADPRKLRKASMYQTTYPCLQCALKIVKAGITHVYYVDPYPLPESDWIKEDLFKGKVTLRKFYGVKSAFAYDRLFRNRHQTR